MITGYRDLIVWQKATDACASIYALTRSFPQEEIYGLTSQMRRAAVSVASNIAEGRGRASRQEFKQFLLIARGSLCELETQLIIAEKLDYINKSQFDDLMSLYAEIGKMLNSLIMKLAQKPQSAPSSPDPRSLIPDP